MEAVAMPMSFISLEAMNIATLARAATKPSHGWWQNWQALHDMCIEDSTNLRGFMLLDTPQLLIR
eukprot:5697863-Karenia_brevis.AAC.1